MVNAREGEVVSELHKKVQRILDKHSAWITAPNEKVVNDIVVALATLTKRDRMHMVMDGAIAQMQKIKDE